MLNLEVKDAVPDVSYALLAMETMGDRIRQQRNGRGLTQDQRLAPLLAPELDIVVWAVRAPTASVSSAVARRLFELAARHDTPGPGHVPAHHGRGGGSGHDLGCR